MSTIEALTKTNTFVSGQTAVASQVNTNFDEAISKINEIITFIADTLATDLVKLAAMTASATELNYVEGVTSALQTQLNALSSSISSLSSGKEDVDANIVRANVAKKLTAGYTITPTALSGTSITPDLDSRNMWTLTTTGNTTINNPSNLDAGTWILFANAGAHTLTLGAGYDIVYGAWVQSVVNIITVVSDGTTCYVYIDQP